MDIVNAEFFGNWKHDGCQQAHHGTVLDEGESDAVHLDGTVRQCGLLRRLVAAWLQPALCQAPADIGAM